MAHSLHNIQVGENAPKEFVVVVETPKGSTIKYETNGKNGEVEFVREVNGNIPFPFDYGFIPETLWDDGDALDVVLLSSKPRDSGETVMARPVALLEMTDDGEGDTKIIAVPLEDDLYKDMNDLPDLSEDTRLEYKSFFETYKESGGAHGVIVSSYQGKQEALDATERGLSLYRERSGQNTTE